MALSLQEQLLKAGLTDKKKVRQVKQQKHKQVKAQQKHKQVETDEAKLAAAAAIEAKKIKDRELNQQAKIEADKKAIAAQIKQLITVNKQPKGKGDVVCNFTDGTLIKRIYVNATTQKHIAQGRLAIVKYEQGYELVPMPVADKIAERDEQCVVYRVDKLDQQPAESSETDDWYADYQIPDDLSW